MTVSEPERLSLRIRVTQAVGPLSDIRVIMMPGWRGARGWPGPRAYGPGGPDHST